MVTAATGQGPRTYTSASFRYLCLAQMVQTYFWHFLLSLISGMATWGQEHPQVSSISLSHSAVGAEQSYALTI